MNKEKEVSMCTNCSRENFPFHDVREMDHITFNRKFLASEDMKLFFKGLNDFNKQQNENCNNPIDNVDLTQYLTVNTLILNHLKFIKLTTKCFPYYT